MKNDYYTTYNRNLQKQLPFEEIPANDWMFLPELCLKDFEGSRNSQSSSLKSSL